MHRCDLSSAHAFSVHVRVQIFSFYKNTSHTGLGHTPLQYELILTNYFRNDCFWIRQHSEVLRVRSSTHEFGGDTINSPASAQLTHVLLTCRIYSLHPHIFRSLKSLQHQLEVQNLIYHLHQIWMSQRGVSPWGKIPGICEPMKQTRRLLAEYSSEVGPG